MKTDYITSEQMESGQCNYKSAATCTYSVPHTGGTVAPIKPQPITGLAPAANYKARYFSQREAYSAEEQPIRSALLSSSCSGGGGGEAGAAAAHPQRFLAPLWGREQLEPELFLPITQHSEPLGTYGVTGVVAAGLQEPESG